MQENICFACVPLFINILLTDASVARPAFQTHNKTDCPSANVFLIRDYLPITLNRLPKTNCETKYYCGTLLHEYQAEVQCRDLLIHV